ncbi:MAG: 50S ribosome-binding GTPase [Firmicutes bacterium]|nr:50S ribosome-binding GTPase [Bacillota bacterium]
MKQPRICPGCGAPFQTDNPAGPGYVPREVLQKGGKDLICRRCFRLANYAEETPIDLRNERYVEAVRAAVKNAGVVWLLVDIIDFAGTWLPEFRELCEGKPVLLVVNKVDLLPVRSRYSEVVAWVRQEAAVGGWRPDEVLAVSGQTGYGVGQLAGHSRALAKNARAKGPEGVGHPNTADGPARAKGPGAGEPTRVAIMGATNVGKSTLVRRLLKEYGVVESGAPTVSRFRGTTLGMLEREIGEVRLVVVDTPGIVPRGRLGDQLCPDCAARLVPTRGLNSKLFELQAGQALMFGGLASVVVEKVGGSNEGGKETSMLGPEASVLLAFVSDEVTLHRTTAERWEAVRDEHGGDWLQPPCVSCRDRLSSGGWEGQSFEVLPLQDLAIAGLGWVTVRRTPVRLAVYVPAGTLCRIRPALVGPRPAGPKTSTR